MLEFIRFGLKTGFGGFPVDGFIEIQSDHVGCIDKRKAQIFSHQFGAEIFTAADELVL